MATRINRSSGPLRPAPSHASPVGRTPAQATARDELSNGRGTALRAATGRRLGSSAIGAGSSTPGTARVTSLGALAFRGPACAPGPGVDVGGPSKGEAIANARALFVSDAKKAGTLGGTVTDYKEVTDTGFSTEASAQLEKNRELEQQALAKLPAPDQQRYRDLQAKLVKDPTAGLAMQTMLLEGRLPGAKDLRDGKTLLEQLDGLSKQALAPGLEDCDQLLAQTVKEVFIPESIAQGGRGTCGPTAAIISLAASNPAEYVRLVSGLASPDGTVEMANGDTLTRESDTLADDGAKRSVSQRLLGPAVMEYANGVLGYANQTDRSLFVFKGAFPERLLEALFDREFIAQDGDGETLAPLVEAALEAGKTPVLVTLEWPEPGQTHELWVERIEQVGDEKFVVLANPWGQTERVPYDEFQAHLEQVVSPE